MVTNNPGTPIARNRNPKRTVSIASTPCVGRDNSGDVTAARYNRTNPNGYRNQPPKPRSVIRSNKSSNHCGKVCAQLLAALSSRNMQATAATSMTAMTANALADGRGGFIPRRPPGTQHQFPKYFRTFPRGGQPATT